MEEVKTTEEGFEKKKKIHDLVKEINKNIANTADVQFVLNGPGTFTAVYEGGKFSKVPLLGFEAFHLSKIYISKKQRPILCFAPNDASKFTHIELSLAQAKKCFANITQYLNDAGITTALKKIDELLNEDAATLEFKEKADRYENIGWGAW